MMDFDGSATSGCIDKRMNLCITLPTCRNILCSVAPGLVRVVPLRHEVVHILDLHTPSGMTMGGISPIAVYYLPRRQLNFPY